MTSTINLNDFALESDEKGTLVGGKSDHVFIKNVKTGRILEVPFADVADFYGFEEINQSQETAVEEPKIEMVSADVEDPKLNHYNNVLVFKWDEEQTRFMLQAYNKYVGCVGRFKKFRTKKLMWAHIARQLGSKFKVHLTAKQVETRLKCVSKRRKKEYDDNDTSGAVRQITVYNDDISDGDGDGDGAEQGDSSCIEKELSSERFFKTFDAFTAKPASHNSDRSDVSLSPSPESQSLSQSQSEQQMLQRLLDQKSDFFLKYFEMKDRREEDIRKEKHRYNEEKLKILSEIVTESKKKERQKSKTPIKLL